MFNYPPISTVADAKLRTRSLRRKPHGLMETLVVWLLCAFVFVLPTDLRLPDGKSLAMRLGYACLLLGIAGVVKRRSAVLPGRGFWVLFGFVVWSSCTLAWAQFPDDAVHKVITYWALFAIAAIIPQYAWDPGVRARLLNAYVTGCALGVAGTAVNFILTRPYAAPGELEMEGRYSFSTDPNYLGLGLVIGIPLAILGANRATARWQKLMLWSYVPAGVFGVLMTGSRGAAIALLALPLVYAFSVSTRVRMRLLAGVALCVMLAWIIPPQISERYMSIPEELRYGSLSDRRELWDLGAAAAREHPIQGIGAGAAEGMLSIAAHNTPLELMLEGGVVSLAFFYGAFLIGLRRMWQQDREECWPMLVVCVAWFIGSLSLSWEVNTVSWFLVAIVNSTLVAERVSAEAKVAGETLAHAR